MLVDLQRVAAAQRIEPCLIGAAALRLAPQQRAVPALSRTTRDWDFAVAVRTWRSFEDLAAQVTAVRGGFRRATEPHRFVHQLGSTLDVVPFGPLESPSGTIRWPDGSVMSTMGFTVLDEHHEAHDLGQGLSLAVATLPALAGLKLIAYGDRRPAVLRDVRDLYHIARSHPWDHEGVLDAPAEAAVRSGVVGFADAGAFVLGREIALTFDATALACMEGLLAGVEDPWGELVEHVVRERLGAIEERDREPVCACMQALRAGMFGK